MTPNVWVAFVAAFSIPSNESMNQTMTNKFSSSLTALSWRRSIRINRMNHQCSKPPTVHHGTLQTLSLVGLKQLLHKTGGNVYGRRWRKNYIIYKIQCGNLKIRYEILMDLKSPHCFISLLVLIHFSANTKYVQMKLLLKIDFLMSQWKSQKLYF